MAILRKSKKRLERERLEAEKLRAEKERKIKEVVILGRSIDSIEAEFSAILSRLCLSEEMKRLHETNEFLVREARKRHDLRIFMVELTISAPIAEMVSKKKKQTHRQAEAQ